MLGPLGYIMIIAESNTKHCTNTGRHTMPACLGYWAIGLYYDNRRNSVNKQLSLANPCFAPCGTLNCENCENCKLIRRITLGVLPCALLTACLGRVGCLTAALLPCPGRILCDLCVCVYVCMCVCVYVCMCVCVYVCIRANSV